MEFVLSCDSSCVSMDPAEFDAKVKEGEARVAAKKNLSQPVVVLFDEQKELDRITEAAQMVYSSPVATPKSPSEEASEAVSTSASTSGSAEVLVRVETTVVKGSLGIGLDLSAAANGMALVRRFKMMPPGVVNPATQCVPAIEPGDIIVTVNGRECSLLSDVVSAIKSSSEQVKLSLDRRVTSAN